MFSAKRISLISLALLAVSSWTNSAFAAEPSAASLSAAVATDSATPLASALPAVAPAIEVVRRNPLGSKAVSANALAAKRGGDGVFNENRLKGVVADNKASNLTTGMNIISEGAFAGSSGMPTVIQNSGNNVLIQNSTIVNVQVK